MFACKGGLMGWIFGHQFLKYQGGYIYKSGHCFRCGKKGGT